MIQKRNTGLDIARLTAMVMVWICHSGYFSVGIRYPLLSFSGVLCVEIFFVLSGFLVGRSMIQAVTLERPGPALKRFYVNRAFRTLPLYYLTLLVISITAGRPVQVQYLLFLQDFWPGDMSFTAPLWTLPIEIWFYFLVPPLLLGLYRLLHRRWTEEQAMVGAIAILYAIPLLLRILHAPNTADWDAGIRKQLPLRMDSVMTGMLLAAFKLYLGETYWKTAKNHLCLALSLGGIAGMYLYYCKYLVEDSWFNQSVFWKIFLFTLIPALCAVLIAYLENAQWLSRLCGKFGSAVICGISSLGYCIYLIHMLVFEKVSLYFLDAGFLKSWIGFGLAIGLTIGLSWGIYAVIEKPLMKLRDRILQTL